MLSDSNTFVTLSGIPELVTQLRIDNESVTNVVNTCRRRYEINNNYLRIHSNMRISQESHETMSLLGAGD